MKNWNLKAILVYIVSYWGVITYSDHSTSWKKDRSGTQSRSWEQELKQNHREMLHTGLFSMTNSAPPTSFETDSHCAALTGLELYRLGWPWTQKDLPNSASPVIGLLYATMPFSELHFFIQLRTTFPGVKNSDQDPALPIPDLLWRVRASS